uniref:Putative secreted peptide n=1 Tax=Anopheles braziliensis TaxID=58242 RepID=A0A2M3ZXI8_9DIPT
MMIFLFCLLFSAIPCWLILCNSFTSTLLLLLPSPSMPIPSQQPIRISVSFLFLLHIHSSRVELQFSN